MAAIRLRLESIQEELAQCIVHILGMWQDLQR